MTRWEITNIMISGDFETKLPLWDISLSYMNCEYDPENFPAVRLRLDAPKCTFLLYSNGKFVLTGIKEEAEITKAIEQLKYIIMEVIQNGINERAKRTANQVSRRQS